MPSDEDVAIPDYDEIYLTMGEWDDDAEICWCWHQVGEKDVKYIRADLVEKKIAEAERETIQRCLAACAKIINVCHEQYKLHRGIDDRIAKNYGYSSVGAQRCKFEIENLLD